MIFNGKTGPLGFRVICGLMLFSIVAGCDEALLQADLQNGSADDQIVVIGREEYQADRREFREKTGDTVYFGPGSHALTKRSKNTLKRQAQWIRSHPGYTMVVEGYADESGPYGYNRPLAARRSQAVVNYLVSQGVTWDRIVPGVTHGEEHPARLCSDPSCLAENRRAVSHIVRDDLL